MKRMWMAFVLLALFNSFFIKKIRSQNIAGEWTGNYSKTFLGMNPEKLVVDIKLDKDSVVTGASHLYYKKNRFEHYSIKGIFRQTDSTISFDEYAATAINLPSLAEAADGNYHMKLRVTDSSLRFEGKWRDNDRSFLHLPTCQVWLEKLNPDATIKTPPADTIIPTSIAEKKKLERKREFQSDIFLFKDETDSIKISIFDNGDVDGDVISLYLDNVPLIKNTAISEKPLEMYISVNRSKPMPILLLVAESTGSIFPCTAVMVIATSKNKYQIHLSSTFETNAAVRFLLKP